VNEVRMVSFDLYGLDGNDYEGPLSLSPKDAVSTACGRFVQTDEKVVVALRRPLIPYLSRMTSKSEG
jgi:hypothetical protein